MINLNDKYKRITETLISRKITISTMESCTSGLIACLITNTEGASNVMRGAFVAYCNEAKLMCGVPADTIKQFGVYSNETASDMAEAAREHFATDIGIGVTGTFGNVDEHNSDSVTGRVYYAISFKDDVYEYELTLEKGLSRREYKNIVAEDIADELIKLLDNDNTAYTIDCSKLNDKENAHEYLKKVFDLPEYYGKNLDALHDVLSERAPFEVRVINSEMLTEYGEKILDVIRKANELH